MTRTKPNAGKPCAARDYYPKEIDAKGAWKVRVGGWQPVACECGGWHLERRARVVATEERRAGK